jgi:hypothetical protein
MLAAILGGTRTVQLAKGVHTVKPRLAANVRFFGRHRIAARRHDVVSNQRYGFRSKSFRD